MSGLARSSELHTVTSVSEAVRTSCKVLVRLGLIAQTGRPEELSQALILTGAPERPLQLAVRALTASLLGM